jgi:hypothetical protein
MFKLNNWNKVQLKSFLLIILIGYFTQSTFAQENSTKRAILKGKIISIDPGHGGSAATDSYRQGPTGEREEWIDLRVGLLLKEILEQKLMSSDDWQLLESYTRALYRKGSEMASERGLILVDTKYEFGRVGDQIVLIDEIHTPDSSRYFYKEGYEERQSTGVPQQQLSKEFVREWLMANNFQGLDGQAMPEMPDEFVWEISARYIKLYELITGRTFDKAVVTDITRRIEKNISSFLN